MSASLIGRLGSSTFRLSITAVLMSPAGSRFSQAYLNRITRRVLNLVGQYLRRTLERGGSFWEYQKGIPLGCPLRQLIGAFFLNALDAAAAKLRVFYIRFMDDILILAPTRWQLRGAVKVVKETLGKLSLEKQPDKTFIGRIERGFDFLGYHFSPTGLAVAKQTIANFIEKASQLYEQERRAGSTVFPFDMYVRQWLKWARAGLVNRIQRSRLCIISDALNPSDRNVPAVDPHPWCEAANTTPTAWPFPMAKNYII